MLSPIRLKSRIQSLAPVTFAFLLYLVTGLVTGLYLFGQVGFVISGRRLYALEIIALAGSLLLVASAFLSLSVPMTRTALVGAALLWVYYGMALIAGWRNVAIHDSNYPLEMYAAPLLLVMATLYAALGIKKFLPLSLSWSAPQKTPYSDTATFLFFAVFCSALLAAYFVAGNGRAEMNFFTPIRTITVGMEKTRETMGPSDPTKRSLLYSGKDEDCIATFQSSEELAKYIDSFGSAVPVTVAVYGDPPSNGVILKVGDWPWRKLTPQERVFGTRLNPKISDRQSNCFAD